MLGIGGGCSTQFTHAASFLWRFKLPVNWDRVWYGVVAKGVTSLLDLQEGVGFDHDLSCCIKLGIGKAGMETALAEQVFMNDRNGKTLKDKADGTQPSDP